MKEIYLRPEIVVIEIDMCSMSSTSVYIDDKSPGDFKEDLSKRRRGTWGNLWRNDYNKTIHIT